MHSLVQPGVIRNAALAALITTAACWPRLACWEERPYSLGFALIVLAWAGFILWSFVFGWYSEYSGQPFLLIRTHPGVWGIATLCGVLGAAMLHWQIDPVLRPLAPRDYPENWPVLGAMTLFALALDQLFLCFAPMAFFLRLSRSPKVAASLTVLFGLALLYLKARALPGDFSAFFVFELFAWRAIVGFLSVYFLLKGGALVTLWWILLLQIRHPLAWQNS
jgi:hypothetical protein